VAALVSIRDLVKTYPTGTRALDGISLDFHKGEFIVLIGLSGSGKSTLLRCINRLVDPTSGTVIFDGMDVTRAKGMELRRIRRRIGMIFQQFNLVKRSSVFTNVLAGRLGYRTTWRTIAGLPTREDVALADEHEVEELLLEQRALFVPFVGEKIFHRLCKERSKSSTFANGTPATSRAAQSCRPPPCRTLATWPPHSLTTRPWACS